ncbi:uncharacterized protein BDV17DRAFT_253957 [Aspergillus undulatus]|uniref:uncharacterized protein n=1 Tax=Aspergillus undulatus TaxID=1810928 RepID=UPI003CCCF3CA
MERTRVIGDALQISAYWGGGQPAVMTLRGTWEFPLRPTVVQAWEAVTLNHRVHGSIIVKELLDAGAVVKSHGDAIHHLKLLDPVIWPVSSWQIRVEHKVREGVLVTPTVGSRGTNNW